ncbi:hypothetical protein AA18895_0581 [Acetobacter ghanensis DSM 18895]|nr:hypothetical protein AA18895_0581 [Acetobacter ghanensis DSM 18895]
MALTSVRVAASSKKPPGLWLRGFFCCVGLGGRLVRVMAVSVWGIKKGTGMSGAFSVGSLLLWQA